MAGSIARDRSGPFHIRPGYQVRRNCRHSEQQLPNRRDNDIAPWAGSEPPTRPGDGCIVAASAR